MTDTDSPSAMARELIRKGDILSSRMEDGKRTHLDEAFALFRQAAELDPTNFDAHYNRGIVLYWQRKWREAESLLRKAIEIRPESVDALVALGYAIAYQNRFLEGAEFFRRIYAQGAADSDSYLALGRLLMLGERPDEAREVLIRAAEINPDNRTILHYLALAHLGCGHLQDAIKTRRRIKELAPGQAERRRASLDATARGRDLFRAGRDREALAEFRRALSLDIDDGAIHRDAELCVRNLRSEGAVPHPEPPLAPLSPVEQEIVEIFNMFYYFLNSRNRRTITLDWFGYECLKTPGDMWAYQEIVFATKPDLIVECGTFKGASALYFASLLQLIGKGKVISIDIEKRPGRPEHWRIEYIVGSSTAPDVLEQVRRKLPKKGNVMVVLDSDHSRDHVLAELRAYGPLVTKDCYLVVEDGNVNFRPIHNELSPNDGPTEAIMEFLKETDAFHIDKSRERFLVSVCPNGFLRRI